MSARIAAIYVASAKGAPMAERHEIDAIAGAGLKGDRYAERAGTFSDRDGGGRHVTLIEREAIDAVNRDGISLGEAETRRNLVTEGVRLNDLVGVDFRIGDVALRGIRLCHPCTYLEETTRPGIRDALKNRGGLRADIVEGGTVRIGDAVVTVPG